MTSPEAAWRFYKAFHHQRWEVFNSRKICQITYARVQVQIYNVHTYTLVNQSLDQFYEKYDDMVTMCLFCYIWSSIKGLEDLKEHFKSSKFPCEAELYLPVVFSPPRDGKRLTELVSINGCTRLNHLERMDCQDHSLSGSCCNSDHE